MASEEARNYNGSLGWSLDGVQEQSPWLGSQEAILPELTTFYTVILADEGLGFELSRLIKTRRYSVNRTHKSISSTELQFH